MYSKITATAGYLPKNIVTNDKIADMVDSSHEWIVERTGIAQRHMVSPGETTTDMAISAAQSLITSHNIAPESIDMVLVATCTPNRLMPSTACAVQAALGLLAIPAFDINAACSGFLYALSIADQFIKTGACKNVLLIGADAMTQVVDWSDRSSCILFGDGAGAVLLSQSEDPGIMCHALGADGSCQHVLETAGNLLESVEPPFIQMQGREVFKKAVTKLSQVVHELLKEAKVDAEAIAWLIPHQANKRIIESTAKSLNMPMSNVILTIDKHANTSAASIPLALHEGISKGDIQRGDLLLLEAFGAGLTWGGSLIRY